MYSAVINCGDRTLGLKTKKQKNPSLMVPENWCEKDYNKRKRKLS